MKHWPLYGLRLRTPRLELRLARPDELDGLADAALGGVHDPAEMPFLVPWTAQPPDQVAAGVLQHHWRSLADWKPERWHLHCAVLLDGVPVGVQDIAGADFAIARTVRTGSWLALAHQGRGLGTEMRAAVLHLAFAGLGALTATTAAFADNPASLGVTRKLGYAPNGVTHRAVAGKAREDRDFLLTRDAWARHATIEVELDGLEPCLPYFGADQPL